VAVTTIPETFGNSSKQRF